MVAISTMRRVWMTVSLAVALLSFYPAWVGRTSWWLPGLAITFFLVFLLEPLLLTWELRKSGDLLQITDEGVLRRLARGANEYVRWDDLREVSVVSAQNAGTGAAEDYFYVLAGSGKSGVLVSQALAAKHDLLSHLAKLPGFDHRGVADAMHASGAQRFVLWRARPFIGEATVIPMNRLEPPAQPPRTLH
jgi:hypothetical protein